MDTDATSRPTSPPKERALAVASPDPATQPSAAVNNEDTVIGDVPSEDTTTKDHEDGTKAESPKDNAEEKSPERLTTSPLLSWTTRAKIKSEIRKRTGTEWSTLAIDTFLDSAQAIDLIIKSFAYEEPSSDNSNNAGPREIAKPEMKHMSWEEWRKTGRAKSKGTRKDHSAIDVLFEEPQPLWTSGRSSSQRSLKFIDAIGTDNRQHAMNKEQSPLPARIRINSAPAKRLLDAICDDKLAYEMPADPLIIFRPYKVLTIHQEHIKSKLSEIERLYSERLDDNNKISKMANEQMHKAYDEVNGSPYKAEGEQECKDDANLQDNNTNEIDTSMGDAEYLAQRKFPDGGIFFTGTDWSILTLSEIKEAVDDFTCLVRFIDETLNPVRNYLQNQPTSIIFSNIWHLFPTGSLIYCKERSTPQKIWKVLQASGGRRYMSTPREEIQDWDTKYSPFVVDSYHWDYDGSNFVRVYRRFKIEVFDQSLPVEALQIMPLTVAENLLTGVNREDFRKQGTQFLTYRTPQHRYYQGTTLTQTPSGEPMFRQNKDDIGSHRMFTERVESQVVVDFERGVQANPEWTPMSTEAEPWKMDPAELEDGLEYPEKDNVWDSRMSAMLLKEEEAKRKQWDKGDSRPDGDDLLLFPDRVFGYVLRTRSWACLRLSADETGEECLMHIDQQLNPWKDLEIPEGHKNVVQALIETQFSKDKSKDTHFDLVREKGKGVILLLHGVPGVGKTATAECVAASYSKPLLPITCGDLGLKPKEVEATLQTAFQLAQAWDCVMLLDEADIFLAQRTNADIERNALVSVFLRILEYYEGILFLTTNRVGVFDEAFKSRIHMALYYPPLNWLTTEKIWRNLIRRARESVMKVECNPDDLIRFAWQLFEDQDKNTKSIGPAWNGRQIRNAFQSAIALARNECSGSHANVMIEPRHFKTVADVSNQFNHYIWRVKSSRTDADIAREIQSRDDNFGHFTHTQGSSHNHQTYQHPPPAQTPMPMPMRQATPNVNPFQGFSTPQSAQQPNYQVATGSPYNPNQSAFYTSAQAPIPFNVQQTYNTQQPQYAQHLQPPPGQQQFQAPQTPPGQQYQQPQAMPGQQYQMVPQQPGVQPQYQPGVQGGYSTAGAAGPSVQGREIAPHQPQAQAS